MVRIRLRRVGKKKQPSFRLVAADKESPRDGRFLEILGFYNPRTEPATIKLKEDRIYDWMSKGAQMSDGAEAVLRAAGYLERYERFKAGEDVEKLMEEAAAAEAARNISSKTRREPPKGKPKAKPVEAKEEAPAEVAAEAEEEAPAVVEAEAEAPVEEAKEEEAPTEEPKAEEAPAEEAKAEEAAPAEVEAEAEAPVEEAKEEEVKEEEPAEEAAAEESAAEKAEEETPDIMSSRASIDRLELPANISSALSEGGYKTVGKLAKQMESDQQALLDISGIGPKALETIEEKLKEFTP